MSVPSLTTTIIQPQNIVINQVPLTTVIPTVNAAAAVPIATALTPAPLESSGEIKTGIVVESIPIAGTANLVGVQTVPMQNASPAKQPVVPPTNSAADHHQILPESRLSDLVREVDANLVLEEEVEEVLLSYIDEFIDRVLKGACTLAKHRQENTIDVKDVQQFITRNYNIWTPGSGTDELKPYKRNMTMESHKQRMALIRRALKKY